MRVLFLVDCFPTISESYIRVELEYAVSNGVEIAVAAEKAVGNGYPVPPGVKVFYGHDSIEQAKKAFEPDLIHVHWANIAHRAYALGLPVTVRGHSFEWSPKLSRLVAAQPEMKKLFVFPGQFSKLAPSPKIASMPVAYSHYRFTDAGTPKRPIVFRAAAGLPGKGFEEFLEIAQRVRRMIDCEFVLATSTPTPVYIAHLVALNERLGCPVQLLMNLSHEECADWMREAKVVLRGHDPASHPYGMPVSIAEGMASGCIVVAKECPEAIDYIGNAGFFYKTLDEGVQKTIDALKAEWPRQCSLERAKLYRDDVVLPSLVAAWKEIALTGS